MIFSPLYVLLLLLCCWWIRGWALLVKHGPAAVGVSAEQNFSAPAADRAVGLVAVVIVHVGDLQICILNKHTPALYHLRLYLVIYGSGSGKKNKNLTLHVWHKPPSNSGWKVAALIFPHERQNSDISDKTQCKSKQKQSPQTANAQTAKGCTFYTSFLFLYFIHHLFWQERRTLNLSDAYFTPYFQCFDAAIMVLELYLCCRAPRVQPWACRGWLWVASRWGNILGVRRWGSGGPKGYHLQRGAQTRHSCTNRCCCEGIRGCSLWFCSLALPVGLSPSCPLGWKPPLAQSSMGLIWSSGLSVSQGGNVFSALTLAIWDIKKRKRKKHHPIQNPEFYFILLDSN